MRYRSLPLFNFMNTIKGTWTTQNTFYIKLEAGVFYYSWHVWITTAICPRNSSDKNCQKKEFETDTRVNKPAGIDFNTAVPLILLIITHNLILTSLVIASIVSKFFNHRFRYFGNRKRIYAIHLIFYHFYRIFWSVIPGEFYHF